MIHNKKIGIWGFGVVGKAAVNFLRNHTTTLSVMDKKILSAEERTFFAHTAIHFVQQTPAVIESFLQNNDLILVSPGIDLRPYVHHQHKCISELDLFSHFFKKPIIAITGTIGKTSTTSLLSSLLGNAGKRVALGGNIGTGMLELISQQEQVDCAVLELSSFQLEYSKTTAPDFVIWTNFYPNHLDRHSTVPDYFSAKMKSVAYQHANQQALLPLEFLEDELFLTMHKGAGCHAFFH